jgi:AcrR family transcriptional regulator
MNVEIIFRKFYLPSLLGSALLRTVNVPTGGGWNGSERPMLSREVIDDFRRERLLDALVQTTVEFGCRRVTVAHIVRAAGTSRNGFYEYFESKDAAILHAMGVGFSEVERRAEEACASVVHEDFATRLRIGLMAALEWVVVNPTAASLCLIEAPALGPEALEVQAAFQDRMAARLAAASPIDPGRPTTTEEFVVGAVISVVVDRLSAKAEGDLIEVMPELTEVLLSLYATAEAA